MQRPATAPTPTKVVEQKSVAPALFNLDITTVPAGAQIFLNDETLGMTPTTVDLPQESGGTLMLKKKGFKDHTIAWPTEDSSLNIALTPKPEVKSLQPKQTVTTPKKIKKTTKPKSKGVKDVSDPFE